MIILWGFTVSFVFAKFERFALTKNLLVGKYSLRNLRKSGGMIADQLIYVLAWWTVHYVISNQTSLVLGEGVLNLKMPSF